MSVTDISTRRDDTTHAELCIAQWIVNGCHRDMPEPRNGTIGTHKQQQQKTAYTHRHTFDVLLLMLPLMMMMCRPELHASSARAHTLTRVGPVYPARAALSPDVCECVCVCASFTRFFCYCSAGGRSVGRSSTLLVIIFCALARRPCTTEPLPPYGVELHALIELPLQRPAPSVSQR